MYLPEHFEEKRQDILVEFIQKHALGCLVINHEEGLEANHLPFEYDAEHHCLLAHIARKNPLYGLLQQPQDALLIFTIDDAYVSPNWYEGKLEHHRTVPTWNYVVIQVKGTVSLIDDEKSLRGLLAKLTRRHEASQQRPWKMGDAPPVYIQDQLNQIALIKFDIKSMVGKFKLSQNRSAQDIVNVAAALQQQGKINLADLMVHRFTESELYE